MLGVDQQIPDAVVFNESREPITMRKLVADGPVLCAFYIFDWSST
jgi:hypothetical protein